MPHCPPPLASVSYPWPPPVLDAAHRRGAGGLPVGRRRQASPLAACAMRQASRVRISSRTSPIWRRVAPLPASRLQCTNAG